MTEEIEMEVRNSLFNEKRDLNVYHHSPRGAYMISYGNSIKVPLATKESGDYVHLSVVSGPGSLEKESWLDLPSWCDFSISGLGNGDFSHSGGRTLVRIPPGPPVWQVKITRPPANDHQNTGNYVTIGDKDHNI
jgi:hypothetical protein